MNNAAALESLKSAKAAAFALLAISAAVLIFAVAVERPNYAGAIAELAALTSITEEGRSEYSNRLLSQFLGDYGDLSVTASDIVISVLVEHGIDATNRAPDASIDPSGVLWHNIEPGISVAEWVSVLSNSDSDIGVFIPDLDSLEAELRRSLASAFRRHTDMEMSEVMVDDIGFAHNRNTGVISGTVLEDLANSDSVQGLVMIGLEPKEQSGSRDIARWLVIPVTGRVVVRPRFSFKGYVISEFERLKLTNLVESLSSTGPAFPEAREFWPEIANLSPSEAVTLLSAAKDESDTQNPIVIWGLSIPAGTVTVFAPLLVLISLVYTRSHLSHLDRHKQDFEDVSGTFGWIVLFPDRVSGWVVTATIGLLPTVSLLVLLFKTWSTLSFWLLSYSLLSIVLAAFLSTMSMRAISSLRSE